MKLDLLVKLKYESSTIILFIGIKYFMRDLLFDLNNNAWPVNWRYASDTLNDVSASSGISSPWQAVNSISKWSFKWRIGDLCKNVLYFHILSFILVFKHDFIRYIDITHIAASNIASDDVTN